MQAGKLSKKVTIEMLMPVVSSDGGAKDSWQPVAEGVWAAIEPLKGREWFEAGGTQSEVDVRIRIRYRKGIKASMRVAQRSRTFDIQYVIDIKTDGRELHLMCKEHGKG